MNEVRIEQEEDQIGEGTLGLFADKNQFNRWQFGELAPFCRGHILEVGRGIGNLSALLLEQFDKVSLSDLRNSYFQTLHAKFDKCKSLEEIFLMDLSDDKLLEKFPGLEAKFDTILTSNVIEHIGDDGLAIRNCHRLLKKGGRLVVLVPAYSALYNTFDTMLGHYRRYTRKSLTTLFRREGFSIVDSHYFNAVGIAGWWFSGKVLKRRCFRRINYHFLTSSSP